MIAKRLPDASDDSVHLVVSLLVRHPELSRVRLLGRSSGIAFLFVVRGRLKAAQCARFRSSILEHLGALHGLEATRPSKTGVRFLSDEDLTFVEVERDAKSLARDEISLIVTLVALAFGDRLVVNPPADEAGEEEFGSSRDDAVGSALDAVRRGKQRKALVGFREERRVLIYFGR